MSLRITDFLMMTRPRLAAMLLALAVDLRPSLYHVVGEQMTWRQVGSWPRLVAGQKDRLPCLLCTDELWYCFWAQSWICGGVVILKLRVSMHHHHLLLSMIQEHLVLFTQRILIGLIQLSLVLERSEVWLMRSMRPVDSFNRDANLLCIGWRARVIRTVFMELALGWVLDHCFLDAWLTVTKPLLSASMLTIFLLKLLLD